MSDLVPGSRPESPDSARAAGSPGGAAPVARRDVRVSDSERNAVVDELRVHYGAGRLDLAEFEDRTRLALSARVRGDLMPLLDDLPELRPPEGAPTPSRPPVRPRPERKGPLSAPSFRAHGYLWLVLSVFFVVIWLGTGGPFWPVFPIAGIGLTVGVHGAVRAAWSDRPPP